LFLVRVPAVAGAEFLFAAPLGVVTEGCAGSGIFARGFEGSPWNFARNSARQA
jgi:hypothetical protein